MFQSFLCPIFIGTLNLKTWPDYYNIIHCCENIYNNNELTK